MIAAFGLLGPISQAFALDDATKTVVLLIGLAVGVDYALSTSSGRGRSGGAACRRTRRSS